MSHMYAWMDGRHLNSLGSCWSQRLTSALLVDRHCFAWVRDVFTQKWGKWLSPTRECGLELSLTRFTSWWRTCPPAVPGAWCSGPWAGHSAWARGGGPHLLMVSIHTSLHFRANFLDLSFFQQTFRLLDNIMNYWSCFNKGWGEFFYEPDWLDGASAERALTFFYQVR